MIDNYVRRRKVFYRSYCCCCSSNILYLQKDKILASISDSDKGSKSTILLKIYGKFGTDSDYRTGLYLLGILHGLVRNNYKFVPIINLSTASKGLGIAG